MRNGNSINRRKLIKLGAATTAGLIIARTGYTQEPALSPEDPTAVALGYYEDHTEVDTAKWTRKAGPDGAGQMCSSCALYMDKGDGLGSCSIFPGKLVKGEGWCNAWVAG
jgi:hypothetical protein